MRRNDDSHDKVWPLPCVEYRVCLAWLYTCTCCCSSARDQKCAVRVPVPGIRATIPSRGTKRRGKRGVRYYGMMFCYGTPRSSPVATGRHGRSRCARWVSKSRNRFRALPGLVGLCRNGVVMVRGPVVPRWPRNRKDGIFIGQRGASSSSSMCLIKKLSHIGRFRWRRINQSSIN